MSSCNRKQNRRSAVTGQAGISLIEVVCSLGLLAGVLVSTTSMFALGNRQVASGRTASEALSIAQSVLEEMQGWSFGQTYAVYGFDGTATSSTVDTRTNAYASKWQSALSSELLNGYATIALDSLGPTLPVPALDSTQAIRVIVTVHWEEGRRQRKVRLGTVRM
jgi:Tfp pilus assembly protein PilV